MKYDALDLNKAMSLLIKSTIIILNSMINSFWKYANLISIYNQISHCKSWCLCTNAILIVVVNLPQLKIVKIILNEMHIYSHAAPRLHMLSYIHCKQSTRRWKLSRSAEVFADSSKGFNLV